MWALHDIRRVRNIIVSRTRVFPLGSGQVLAPPTYRSRGREPVAEAGTGGRDWRGVRCTWRKGVVPRFVLDSRLRCPCGSPVTFPQGFCPALRPSRAPSLAAPGAHPERILRDTPFVRVASREKNPLGAATIPPLRFKIFIGPSTHLSWVNLSNSRSSLCSH